MSARRCLLHISSLLLLLILIIPSKSCQRPKDCNGSRSGCCGDITQWEAATRRAFQGRIRDKVTDIKHVLENNHQALKDHLIASLVRSHRNLHALFSHTYGPFYAEHDKVGIFRVFFKVFSDLYNSLEGAVSSEERIANIVHPFFMRLFRVVFMLLNPLQKIGLAEAECMGRSMDEIVPFGEAPNRIVTHLERTFHGWRQLIIAVGITSKLLEPFENTSLYPECVSSLTRLSVCPACSDTVSLQPCRDLCEKTLSRCLVDWLDLDQQWRTLISWETRLTQRLKEAYSLSSTLDSLPTMLSEAVMTFQERASTVTNKVVTKCLIRDVQMKEDDSMRIRKKRSRQQDRKDLISLRQITIESETHHRVGNRIIDSFKEKLQSMRGFFGALPYQICADPLVSALPEDKCWDGSEEKKEERDTQSPIASPLRGSYLSDGIQMGLLSFRIATFLYGRNYTEYVIEGSARMPDDEDYWESSGDISILQLDAPLVHPVKKSPKTPSITSSASGYLQSPIVRNSSLFPLFLLLRLFFYL